MILVTGATGTIGSEVLAQLTDLGEPVRAMTRDPAKLAGTTRAEVVQGDFSDQDSLARAVDGVEAVFLVTVATPPSAVDDLALLAAAGQAGVRRVVKLSAIGTGEIFDGQLVGSWHLAAEQALTRPGHDGRVYTLTGPELLSVPQQTAILADILGRPVTADRWMASPSSS